MSKSLLDYQLVTHGRREATTRISTLVEGSDIAVDTTDKTTNQVAKEVLFASEIIDEDRMVRLRVCRS